MDHNQLPDYIRNRQGQGDGLAHKAIANVGAGAGPYLSILGDRFTFIDIAGNEQPIQTLYVDVVIVDVNDHMSKMYYATKYDPNNPLPPTCFSDNGLAPSISAGEPQSPTCASCQWNVWGSKISEMGSKVKACRDEQKLAIIVPGMPNSMFRLTVPPNSLANWRAYVAKFLNAAFGMSEMVTRLSFAGGGERGTLVFDPAPQPWLDAATLAVRAQALQTRASDMIVGRLDRPRQGIGGLIQDQRHGMTDSQAAQVEHGNYPPVGASWSAEREQQGRWGAAGPVPMGGQIPFSAQNAGFQPTPMAPPPAQTAPPAPAAAPSEAPQRRRRRTKREMQEAAQNAAPAPVQAPFRPQPNSGIEQFGMQAAPAPSAEIQSAVDSIFGR